MELANCSTRKLLPAGALKPPICETFSVPASAAVPPTSIQSKPLVGVVPASSMLTTLAALSTRLPVTISLPGEAPGDRLTVPSVTVPSTVPLPLRLPALSARSPCSVPPPSTTVPLCCVTPPVKVEVPLCTLSVPRLFRACVKLSPPPRLIVPWLSMALVMVAPARFSVPVLVSAPELVQATVLVGGRLRLPPLMLRLPLPPKAPPVRLKSPPTSSVPLLVRVPPIRFRATPAGSTVLPLSVRLPDCSVSEPSGSVRLLKPKFSPSITRSPVPANRKVPPPEKPSVPVPPIVPSSQLKVPDGLLMSSVLPDGMAISPPSCRACVPATATVPATLKLP